MIRYLIFPVYYSRICLYIPLADVDLYITLGYE